jgi:serine phosphatase RsbU (regulator of sigma subunit)
VEVKEQIQKQLDLISEGKEEAVTVFPLLWKNSVFIKGNEYFELLSLIKSRLALEPKTEALLFFCEGFENFLKGNHLDMFRRLLEAQEKFREIKDEEGVGMTFATSGMAYMQIGQLDKAQEAFHNAFSRLHKDSIYSHFFKLGLYQAGELHTQLKDFEQALRYFQQGREASEHEPILRARMLNGIGNIHLNKGEFDKALEFFELSLSNGGMENILIETRNYSDIGIYYTKTGDITKAKEWIHKSLEKRLKENLQSPVIAPAITNYLQLANIYIDEGDLNLALDNAKKALEIASQMNFIKRQVEVHEVLSRVYEKKGEIVKAFDHFKKYNKLKEESFNMETAQRIKQLAVHHEVESMKKEKEIFRLRNVELKSALDDIESSIHYAKRLQEAMLPPPSLLESSVKSHFILYRPKDIVSGDFYWFDTKGGKLYFAVGDCTGHGVPGAMVSVLCQTALNRALNEFDLSKPSDILNKTRELVLKAFMKTDSEVKDGMDISLCAYCPETKKLEFAGANNPLWILQSDKTIKEIKADKQPIGFYPDMRSFTNHIFELKEETKLYLFSDGYADQFGGEAGKKFRYLQLKEMIEKNSGDPMQKQGLTYDIAFEAWRGNFEQLDDVTMIGIHL